MLFSLKFVDKTKIESYAIFTNCSSSTFRQELEIYRLHNYYYYHLFTANAYLQFFYRYYNV